MSAQNKVISLVNITHTYRSREMEFSALHDVTFDLHQGQSCAIVGTSGSGKSTLLNILGLLDTPTSGSYFMNGKEVSRLDEDQRANLRNRYIGFVFQGFNLLPRLNAIDNVALPLLYRGASHSEARGQAIVQLEKVGLSDKLKSKPADLSGGQRQLIAIARSLIGSPSLILADEPTGNLDPETGQSIISLLLDLNKNDDVTLVLVTHDIALAQQLNRCVRFSKGKITEDFVADIAKEVHG